MNHIVYQSVTKRRRFRKIISLINKIIRLINKIKRRFNLLKRRLIFQ